MARYQSTVVVHKNTCEMIVSNAMQARVMRASLAYMCECDSMRMREHNFGCGWCCRLFRCRCICCFPKWRRSTFYCLCAFRTLQMQLAFAATHTLYVYTPCTRRGQRMVSNSNHKFLCHGTNECPRPWHERTSIQHDTIRCITRFERCNTRHSQTI